MILPNLGHTFVGVFYIIVSSQFSAATAKGKFNLGNTEHYHSQLTSSNDFLLLLELIT